MEHNRIRITECLKVALFAPMVSVAIAQSSLAAEPLYPKSVLTAEPAIDPFSGSVGKRVSPTDKADREGGDVAPDSDDDPSHQDILEKKRILDAARKALSIKMRDLNASAAELAKDKPPREAIDKDAASRLVGIYEAMPPRQAAAIFDVMDTHVLVGIASQMNTRKLSSIMANMSPDRVNLVSQFLVGVRSFPSRGATMGKSEILIHGQLPPIAPLIPSRQ